MSEILAIRDHPSVLQQRHQLFIADPMLLGDLRRVADTQWRTRTDAEGRFEWDSAPAEPVLFWFEANGYNWLRDVPLVGDGSVHEIELTQKAMQ